MAKTLELPQLGQTMEEGTIVSCLVKVGDKVSKGDVIFEVETDKATLEMESSAEGFVKKILVKTGETIPVGDPVIILGDKDEEIADDAAPASDKTETKKEEPAAAKADTAAVPAGLKVLELPQLGQTMEEGTIVSCLVNVGDKVSRGDVIFEVETDKATLEMEAAQAGFVKAILVNNGETVPVGDPVIVLADDKDEAVSDEVISSLKSGKPSQSAPEKTEEPKAPAKTARPAPAAKPAAPAPSAERTFASPRAKLTAQELGIDINRVQPTPGALRITEADVRKAAAAGAGAKPAAAAFTSTLPQMPQPEHQLGESVKMSRMQKVVGDRMLQSKQQIPCFYLNTTADMTDLFEYRRQLNAGGGQKVSFNDFIIKAMAVAVKQFPLMAGQVDGGDIKIAGDVSVGLAISVEDGLVAPMCKAADKKSLSEIAAYNAEMITRAKSGKITPDDLAGGCITLSNLGAFGIEWFIPIVVPGQASILGTGKIKDTLVPFNGGIALRKQMSLTLAVDHKVANGLYAAQFLDYIRALLENPAELS
jgi:pyruvate dehydrogenase E2 component (dihydrolipoamide acetyltransferase)